MQRKWNGDLTTNDLLASNPFYVLRQEEEEENIGDIVSSSRTSRKPSVTDRQEPTTIFDILEGLNGFLLADLNRIIAEYAFLIPMVWLSGEKTTIVAGSSAVHSIAQTSWHDSDPYWWTLRFPTRRSDGYVGVVSALGALHFWRHGQITCEPFTDGCLIFHPSSISPWPEASSVRFIVKSTLGHLNVWETILAIEIDGQVQNGLAYFYQESTESHPLSHFYTDVYLYHSQATILPLT